jgi:hypothetical protein
MLARPFFAINRQQMSESVDTIDPQILQFMHLTPVFNFEQEHRYQDLRNIGSEIQSIASHFNAYADLGQRMCSEFASLRKTLSRMEVMSTDAFLRPLGKLFHAVDRAFTCHFNDVAQKIVPDLNSFVKKELEELSTLEREHQRLLKDYNSAEEDYTNLKAQVSKPKKEKVEQALKQAHTRSTLASFEFFQKMEGIELKIRHIVPETFLIFLTSVTTPFRDALGAIDEHEELLNSAQTSVQELKQRIKDFSQPSVQTKQLLSSQIPVFWNRLVEPFTRTNQTSIQGYLWKKKMGGISRTFHKRFFTLSNGVLSWGKTIDSALRTGKAIQLVLCSVRPDNSTGRANCFALATSGSPPMILQALTKWDMDLWLAVIQNSIFMSLRGQEGMSEPGGASILVTADCCADCGASNATWSSVNWALSLCEDCAGEHRGIGASISKVRSFALDEPDPMVHALVDAIGTSKANTVLEFGLPPEEKLKVDADPATRRQFLESKYKNKLWVAPSVDIDFIHAIQEQSLMDVYRCMAAGRLSGQERVFGPLHAAAIVGNPLILHLLCLNLPRVDLIDEEGWSPLCYAAYYDQLMMVEILMGYGAGWQSEGVNAYDVAVARGNEAILGKLTGLMVTGEGQVRGVPHEEVQPMEFKLEQFVSDPSLYRRNLDKQEISVGDQMRINSVVSALRQRLSVRGGQKPRDLESDSFESGP